MEKSRGKLEVLAPAGSFESMKAAIHAGADAVYMGGSRFGARAYADNPQGELLLTAIDYAHLYGAKLYLTVNTLFKEKELEEELYDYLLPCYERGLDAVIVQDIGALCAVREWFPDLPIHASTQMTLCGASAAEFLEGLGVKRIVPARELSFAEIARIREHTDMEIECFAHGALCYCYSGQCLFSSILGGRSGNRGRCAQPCRLSYDALFGGKVLSKKGENALLSPKDLCAVDLLPQIAQAGVCSLKIEGRMKRPEYAAGVTRIYRKYADRYEKYGAGDYRVSEEDRRELFLLFNRDGFSQGYYKQHNGRNMIALQNRQASEKEKQEYERLIASLKKQYVDTQKKIPVSGRLRAESGRPMELELGPSEAPRAGIRLSVRGDCPQQAEKRPMDVAQFERQLRKTGGTPFEWSGLEVETTGELFVPVQALNRLRREAFSRLEEELCGAGRKCARTHVLWQKEEAGRECALQTEERKDPISGIRQTDADASAWLTARGSKGRAPVLHILAETEEQLDAVLLMAEELQRYAAAPLSCICLDTESMEEALPRYTDRIHKAGLKACGVLPAVFRMRTADRYEENSRYWKNLAFDGYMIRNLEEYGFLRRIHWEGELILSHNLYTFNKRSRAFWREKGVSMLTNPLELRRAELLELSGEDSIQIVYGRSPMMLTAGCLHKTLGQCRKREEIWTLRDRYQTEFPVKNYCRDCYNIIYNSRPLYLIDKMEELGELGAGAYAIVFTTENKGQVRNVLEDFLSGGRLMAESMEFTRGHYRRGVE